MKTVIILSKNNTFAGVLNTNQSFELFAKETQKFLYGDINCKVIKIHKKNSTKLKQMIDTYKESLPHKVKKETEGTFNENGNSHTTYKCPKCNCTIHLDWHEKRNFCAECGVKLDWSEIKND